MSNFFSFDSDYRYEPIIKQLDPKTVEKDIALLRHKIIEAIKQIVDQKDLSRAEIALAARISRAIASQIYRGNTDKISTDRLLRIARRLGLKPRIKFSAES